jgi:glutaminyl-peptide cyclotransferase
MRKRTSSRVLLDQAAGPQVAIHQAFITARRRLKPGLLGAVLLVLAQGCSDASTEAISLAPPRVAPVQEAVPIAVLRHDPSAFTQGLLVHDRHLFESTGGRGESEIRQMNLESAEVIRRVEIPAPYFAEGVAIVGPSLYQLTWQENTGFIYDVETLERTGTFNYSGEGWGLASDGTHLIRSDGSNRLLVFDPISFETVRTIDVRDDPHPIHFLNELEWVEGEIWANVWYRDDIARIDPETGIVVGWLDLAGIVPEVRHRNREAVANGIAYDRDRGRVLLTGKLWPEIFEIELPAELRQAAPSATPASTDF